STIVIDETYGHYYLDWSAVVFYFPHYCFRNLHPLVINDTGESRVVLDESADTFTHIVPEQNINILLNTQVDGDLPAPDISGPNKGLIDKVYTFTISGEHPELLPIRFGIDWINSIFTTVNKYTDYTENGSQEVGKSYSTTGNKKIHAISQDENNLNSPSSPVHNIDIGPWPEADLDADRTLIEEGESVSLTWSSEHAESCDGINFNTNGNTDGSVSVSPSSSTEYGVECVSSYDATEKATSYVTITVGEAESPIACGDIPLPEANPANPAEGQVDLLVNQSVIWSIPGGLPEGAVGTPEWIGDSPLGGKSGVSIGNIKYTTIGTKTGGYSVQDELGGVCEKTIEVEVKVDPGYKEI
ncbi:MAG: hypothetical protein MRY49_00455, partial [Candidatus Pacebacteria bacterium]|nr:hypothetical protein [Candidatus Paceibacterota bacterium]